MRGSAIVRRREPAKLLLHGDEVGRQPFDAALVKHVGQHPRQGDAILQREAGAGRRLAAIAEHPPAAVGRAGQVGRVEVEHPRRGVARSGLAVRQQESRMAEYRPRPAARRRAAAAAGRTGRAAPGRAASPAACSAAATRRHSSAAMTSGKRIELPRVTARARDRCGSGYARLFCRSSRWACSQRRPYSARLSPSAASTKRRHAGRNSPGAAKTSSYEPAAPSYPRNSFASTRSSGEGTASISSRSKRAREVCTRVAIVSLLDDRPARATRASTRIDHQLALSAAAEIERQRKVAIRFVARRRRSGRRGGPS